MAQRLYRLNGRPGVTATAPPSRRDRRQLHCPSSATSRRANTRFATPPSETSAAYRLLLDQSLAALVGESGVLEGVRGRRQGRTWSARWRKTGRLHVHAKGHGERSLSPHQLPVRHPVRLIRIRPLPLLQVFYIRTEIPLGSTDFAVLCWLGQSEAHAEHRVARQVGTARVRANPGGYKPSLERARAARAGPGPTSPSVIPPVALYVPCS